MTGRILEKGRGIGGLRWAGAAVVSVVLIGALVWWSDPAAVWGVFRGARGGPLAAAASCYAVVLAARWIRLVGIVEAEGLSWHRLELLWTSSGHSFANQLLPARTGELVFPELWRRATGESRAEGAVYLAAIRVVELGVVVSMFGVGLAVWLGERASTEGAGEWVALVVVGGLALLVALPLLLRGGLRAAEWVLGETWLAGVGWVEPLREAVPAARSAVERLGWRRRGWLVATSTLMWVAMFGVFWWTLAACGTDLGLAQTVVGSAGGIVGNLVPLGGIGSLGTMEAGWTAAFRATGAPSGPVVASGLLVHAIVIVGTGTATAVSTLAWAVLERD